MAAKLLSAKHALHHPVPICKRLELHVALGSLFLRPRLRLVGNDVGMLVAQPVRQLPRCEEVAGLVRQHRLRRSGLQSARAGCWKRDPCAWASVLWALETPQPGPSRTGRHCLAGIPLRPPLWIRPASQCPHCVSLLAPVDSTERETRRCNCFVAHAVAQICQSLICNVST